MNYSQAQEYLGSFVNYEKKSFYDYARVIKLARVKFLFEQLNIKYKDLKVIHVAGTKGKGSTAQFCADILAHSGYKTGLYTSPHVQDFRERIQIINRGWISKQDFSRIITGFRPAVEQIRLSKKYGAITYFELCTALAFQYFLEQRSDYAVLETGLGGRLDATNICDPIVSIITHIGYDHTDKLGKTLPKIAYEKAGIIKPLVPVVSAKQDRLVKKVLIKTSARLNALIFFYGQDFFSEKLKFHSDHTVFDYRFGQLVYPRIKIKLLGKHQLENACLAIAGLNSAKIKIADLKQGLAKTDLAGRFERIKLKPLVILDIAHNQSSFKALDQAIKTYYPKRKIILIFAASLDKDPQAMLDQIDYHKIIFTSFDNPRAFSSYDLRQTCGQPNELITENVNQAYLLAKKTAKPKDIILIAGSVFLVSEAKKTLFRYNIKYSERHI